MSRLLSEHYRLASSESIGLLLSREGVYAASVSAEHNQPKKLDSRHARFSNALFTSQHSQSDVEVLTTALHSVLKGNESKPIPLHIALPDVVIRASIFELDALPKPANRLSDFAAWQLAKEFGLQEQDMECRVVNLGKSGTTHLVYAQAADRYWLDVVRAAMQRCAVVPWSINSQSSYGYNYVMAQGVTPSAYQLLLATDGWSLAAWDHEKRVRLNTSRLLSGNSSKINIDSLTGEIVRTMRATAHKVGASTTPALYLLADQALNPVIDTMQRMLPCRVIEMRDMYNGMVSERFTPGESLAYMTALATS